MCYNCKKCNIALYNGEHEKLDGYCRQHYIEKNGLCRNCAIKLKEHEIPLEYCEECFGIKGRIENIVKRINTLINRHFDAQKNDPAEAARLSEQIEKEEMRRKTAVTEINKLKNRYLPVKYPYNIDDNDDMTY